MDAILIHYRPVDTICSAKKDMLIMETELPSSRHVTTPRNKLREYASNNRIFRMISLL